MTDPDARRGRNISALVVEKSSRHRARGLEVAIDYVKERRQFGRRIADFQVAHATLPVKRMMRDAKTAQIYEGTDQIQRVVVALQLVGRRQL